MENHPDSSRSDLALVLRLHLFIGYLMSRMAQSFDVSPRLPKYEWFRSLARWSCALLDVGNWQYSPHSQTDFREA